MPVHTFAVTEGVAVIVVGNVIARLRVDAQLLRDHRQRQANRQLILWTLRTSTLRILTLRTLSLRDRRTRFLAGNEFFSCRQKVRRIAQRPCRPCANSRARA